MGVICADIKLSVVHTLSATCKVSNITDRGHLRRKDLQKLIAMNKSACLYLIAFSCTLGLVCCTYSSYGSYGSSYKGVNSGNVYYQQLPVPIYRPIPVNTPLTMGIGGYGFGGFPGVFGGSGFGGGGISSLIAIVVIISLLRNFL